MKASRARIIVQGLLLITGVCFSLSGCELLVINSGEGNQNRSSGDIATLNITPTPGELENLRSTICWQSWLVATLRRNKDNQFMGMIEVPGLSLVCQAEGDRPPTPSCPQELKSALGKQIPSGQSAEGSKCEIRIASKISKER